MIAMRASAPKTALVMMRSFERSLIGTPHIAYVVLMAAGNALANILQWDWHMVPKEP